MRNLSNPKFTIAVIILSMSLAIGCKDRLIPVEKVKTKYMYGAWSSVYSENDTRYMLFYKNNDVYADAAEEDGIVILSVTPTDTVLLYAGSFEIVEGYLHTFNTYTNYANEILEFSKARFVLYSETAPGYQRTYEETDTDLLDKSPL